MYVKLLLVHVHIGCVYSIFDINIFILSVYALFIATVGVLINL